MPMEPVIMAGLVGEDVAEDIAGHDHIKLTGVADQLHGGVVHIAGYPKCTSG